MSPETKRTIEIDGVKIEVDLRTAKRVEELRVGSRVKVLKKSYSEWKVYHGVVIGFEPFKNRPTIIVAYCEVTYNEAKIEFLYYSGKDENIEMIAAMDDDKFDLDKDDICNLLDRQMDEHRNKIKSLEDRKAYFLAKFKTYWSPVEPSSVTS